MERHPNYSSGQSLVEYVVVLALIAIVVISVVIGVGQRSQSRLQAVNEGLEESRVATSTAGAGKVAGSGVSTAAKPSRSNQ